MPAEKIRSPKFRGRRKPGVVYKRNDVILDCSHGYSVAVGTLDDLPVGATTFCEDCEIPQGLPRGSTVRKVIRKQEF